jgi:hypothetical protein
MKKLVLPLISVLLFFLLIAGETSNDVRNPQLATGLQKMIQKISENGWIYFKESFKIDPNEFFKNFVTNQCLEFGVPRVPKVRNNRMNQSLL